MPTANVAAAARSPRAIKSRRWLGGALLTGLLLAAAGVVALSARSNAAGRLNPQTRTYLLPPAAWGFGVDNKPSANAAFLLPVRSGDAVRVTQRAAKRGKSVWQDEFVFRKSPLGWGFKRPVAQFGPVTRLARVDVVCAAPLFWGAGQDPLRQLRLEMPARRVRFGFVAQDVPTGTVQVK